MSSKTQITLSRGGTKEHVIRAGQIKVPDLWHIAETVREGKRPGDASGSAAQILKCWSLCHDLLGHVMALPD